VGARNQNRASFNVSDLYYKTDEPGSAISVTQLASGGIFVLWFTYDSNNQPVWYFVSDGDWIRPNTFHGRLYRAAGSSLSGVYDPARFQPSLVGSMQIGFALDSAVMTADLISVGVLPAKLLSRQRL
jgi:hypothetical protein